MKNRYFWISLIMFFSSSCQKESIENEKIKDQEIEKLENLYGIHLKKITSDEIKNSIYIPFETLKECLENTSSPLSRGGEYFNRYDGTAIWNSLTNLNVTIKSLTLSSLPFKFTLKMDLGLGFVASTKLDFKKATLDYGKEIFQCHLTDQNNEYIPSFNWHKVKATFCISFNTKHNGIEYMFDGLIQVNSTIEMGKDQKPINSPFTVTFGITISWG